MRIFRSKHEAEVVETTLLCSDFQPEGWDRPQSTREAVVKPTPWMIIIIINIIIITLLSYFYINAAEFTLKCQLKRHSYNKYLHLKICMRTHFSHLT